MKMNDEPLKILLVEEIDDHAETIRRAFDDLGSSFHIEVVATLAEAQARLQRYTPEIVISDIVLPDGKGTDLLGAAGKDPLFPLVVMTSRDNEQRAAEALKAGAVDCVVKSPETFRTMPDISRRALRVWIYLKERRQAEQRARESEERLRLALESAGEGVWEWNRATGTVQLDQQALEMLGYRPGEPEAGFEFWMDQINSEDRPAAEKALQDYLEGRRDRYSVEFRLRTRDGQWKWVGSNAKVIKYSPDGEPILMIGVHRDISERKQAEEALRAGEERFRAIFDGAKEAVFLKDHDLRYTHVNPAFCDLMGVPTPEILGRKATDLYDEESGKHIEERDSRALAGERIEMEHTRPIRGTLMTFHDTIVPLRDSKNNIIGICGIARDITERSRILTNAHPPSESSFSPAMQPTLDSARIAANTDSIVLLQGESGSGKDHLARWIHEHSRRASGPFFSINCAAVAKELAESELFGHERGAFTGATGRKRGMFELAEGGTILLNEIGELELSLQSKLLAFLDTQSFLRVGGEKHVQIDARLIAATHRNLETEVAEGQFLEPLFYRLSVFPVRVPSLRERTEDIPSLIDVILSGLAKEMQLNEVPIIRPQHLEILSQYAWPGNVRELRNVLERSLMLWKGGDFDLAMPISRPLDRGLSHTVRYVPGKSMRAVTNEVKSFMCAAALEVCKGNKKEAAKLLGISRDAFYRHIKQI
jgi:PAS domain S-box-containing protein